MLQHRSQIHFDGSAISTVTQCRHLPALSQYLVTKTSACPGSVQALSYSGCLPLHCSPSLGLRLNRALPLQGSEALPALPADWLWALSRGTASLKPEPKQLAS